MLKVIYTLISFLTLTVSLLAQQLTNSVFYNGPGNQTDQAVDIIADDFNNVYVTGVSYGGSSTKEDIFTLKYYLDIYGARRVVWSARYNSSANNGNRTDVPFAITRDASGNTYVCGTTYNYGDFTTSDYVTLKYNSSGVLQWAALYNGTGNCYDYAFAIATDVTGNVYVTGESFGSGGAQSDYATIKYNSAGVQQWVKRYDGPYTKDDAAKDVAVDNSGNVYVTGYSLVDGQGFNIITIKYLSNGNQSWLANYNGTGNGNDAGVKIALDNSGNIIVGGTSKGSNAGSDYIVLKYNSSGTQTWASRYNGAANQDDSLKSMALDIFGNIFVTGGSKTSSSNMDYATLKINPSGIVVWQKLYNGPSNGFDCAMDLSVSTRAYEPETFRKVYICVTGQSAGTVTGKDFATIFYDENGNTVWTERFNRNGSNDDIGYACATTNLIKAVYTTGISNNDYGTLAYNKDVPLLPDSPSFENQTKQSFSYPNPFNPSAKIYFSLKSSSFVNLIIYDALGRVVDELINGNLDEGNHNVEWDASNYNSGIFFYRIETNHGIETKKLVLIK